MFKWVCLAVAVIALGVFGWMVNDMRSEVAHTNEIVNKRLPEIIENVRVGTETLANVAKDIESLRDLAGFAGGPNNRSLVRYADSALDFLAAQHGEVGLRKVVGSGLKDTMSVQDWVRDTRREALWLTFRADTEAELLDCLGHNKFGTPWLFAAPGAAPVAIVDYLKQHHPESKTL